MKALEWEGECPREPLRVRILLTARKFALPFFCSSKGFPAGLGDPV